MTRPNNTASLLEVLDQWTATARSSERTACRFLSFGPAPERGLTYRELGVHARAVGALLQDRVSRGDRVILLYPPGLEFVTAFLGSFRAGAVAVPVYPPDPARPGRDLTKLRAIVADARPTLILTTAAIQRMVTGALAEAPDLAAIPWVATDGIDLAAADRCRELGITSGDLAFLQYTSGSTGQPKGVMVSHGNLLHNVQCIQHAFEDDASSTLVSWLPLYHDMGLIGNLLHGLFVGTTCLLMSPMEFLEQPLRWLETISAHRAHTSGGPNFAYELCVRRIAPEQRAGLDLSSWRVAFNGAEPVRQSTIERFTAAFAPHGFRREAFLPCYGLAEATLIVSGAAKAQPPTFEALDTRGLEQGRAIVAAPGDSGRPLVGCGRAVTDHRIEIVEPETGARCAPGEIGEIWVAGPSIARGYWDKPDASVRTFGAMVTSADGQEGPFLRTGDLGFLGDGELFVTGRLKDLIIVRGRNHYPQDLELTAERAHAALRPGCGAAFALDVDEVERLVLVFEIDRRHQETPVEAIAGAVSQAIAEHHALELHALVLIQSGRIPKTTSGKIQRSACRQGHLAGSLPVVATWTRTASPAATAPVAAPAIIDASAQYVDDAATVLAWRAAPAAQRPPRIEAWLRLQAARVLGLAPDQLPAGVPLIRLGLDSLRAVELRSNVERATGVALAIAEIFQAESLGALAASLAERDAGGGGAALQLTAQPASGELLPSFAQQRLWFLAQLEPDSAAYNECIALAVDGPVRADLLTRALDIVVGRHQALRMSFEGRPDAGPVVRIADELTIGLELVDVTALPASSRLEEGTRRLREIATRPFDLGRPPLVRAALVVLGAGHHLFALVVHHALCDARSSEILCDELRAVYEQLLRGETASLPPLAAQYADLARWERARLQGDTLDGLLSYWRRQLAQMPTSLPLPTDRVAARSGRGHTAEFELSAGLSRDLRALAAHEGVTSFTAMLAGFYALLQRYAGQDDVPVGVPVGGRELPEAASLIGFFVNTLVLRGDVSGEPSFRELVARTAATVVGGLEHQALPLELLVEALRPERRATQSPLFNVMFSYQASPAEAFRSGDVTFRPFTLDRGTAQFDLTLTVTDGAESFRGAFEYDAALFEATTIERMVRHFEALLQAAVSSPERRVSELALEAGEVTLVSAVEARPTEPCVHAQIAAWAGLAPEAIAIVDGDERVTYRELEARAERLAQRLRGQGVGAERIVGLSLPRSVDLIVAMVAVLKAGGAYLPVDPGHPAERVRFVLDDAGARIVIANETGDGRFGDRLVVAPGVDAVDVVAADADIAPGDAAPADLAYVLYTSGSTGAPKGVLVEHAALAGYIATVRERFALSADDRVLQFTAATFDVAAEEIFGALTSGATLVLRSDALATSVDAFLEACASQRLTVVDLPTAFWSYVVAELAARQQPFPAGVRLVVVGGEALPLESLHAWQALAARPALINAYGPTEATVSATFWTLAADDDRVIDRVPIGAPLRGVTAYVLDAHGRPVPTGLAGELYLGGDGLARGYLNRPELTAERFVANPFGGGRLYRTGDLVRVLPDSELLFLGRTDHQVKIRGHRIELGEIEAALATHPSVREAVVLCLDSRGDARGDARGEPSLVAFAVPTPGAALDPASLRGYLVPRLPTPMLPSRIAVLDRWPVTAHGKIDRRALAALAPEAATASDAVAPRTPIEELLIGIFRELLGVDVAGTGDDFFALGGHSLMATRLLSRVRDALGVQVPLRHLFEAPTIAGLAARIEGLVRAGQPPAPPLHATAHDGSAPMSFAQQRLWFLDRLEPGGTLYNMCGAYRLRGALDRDALAGALTALVARHEILRTRLTVVGGTPVQVIAPAQPHALSWIDLRSLPADERAAQAVREEEREAAIAFDLAAGPLFRTALIQLADDEHHLLISMHHAIADGWSISILFDDLAALYRAALDAAPAALPALGIQYADHASWQRRWMTGETLDAQVAYWKRRLAGPLPVLQLPTSRRRPPVQTFRGASVDFTIPAELSAALHQLGRRHGGTLFMTLMAAFQVLLQRYSGQDDLLVGTPVAGRTRSETEALIGLFLNTTVIRTDLSGDPSFRDVLARVREATIEAWAHQDVPFEKLVEELNPERSLSHAPIFQALFVLQNTPPVTGALGDVVLDALPVRDQSAKFDLTLSMEEQGEVIAGSLQYNVDLFDASTARHMAEHLLVLLAGIVRAPDSSIARLPLMTDRERDALAAVNATDTPYPDDQCLHQLFEAQAEASPDALAIVSGPHRLTYAELLRHSCRLGHRLRGLGARANAAIAIVMEKGWEQIVAMLGIQAAGSAYLPIDPGIPYERLAYILEHAEVEVVVTQSWVDERMTWPAQVRRVVLGDPSLADEPATRLAPIHTPDDLAYILYTSGSTGRPKGVALRHRGAVNTVCDINARFEVTADDRVIAMSATTFDLSVYDVFGTLAVGAAIVIPEASSMRDPAHWADLVRAERVSIWSSVPAYIQMLIGELAVRRDAEVTSLRVVALSGDTLPVGLPERIRAQLGPIEVVNLGGNTEASIWSVTYPVVEVDPAWQSVPYGHPLTNQRCYVLNAALVPCPTGVPGDLYFAGVGLARDYWRDEDKTRQYFFAHPDTGERIYRTGDLAYWRADGEIILLGRSDFQVKVQGFRIEPGEIELALKKHPDVADTIVVARDDGADKRLVAYLVARGGVPLVTAELRQFLGERLPDYMIPSLFMTVAALPLSGNGKVDRKALPAPDFSTLAIEAYVAPRTPLEEAVAGLWCEVLGLGRIGIHDNFFDLGGHSLLATQLVARLPASLGVELSLRTIFESPTVAEMGVVVAQQLAMHKDDDHLASLLSELEELSDAEVEDRLTQAPRSEG